MVEDCGYWQQRRSRRWAIRVAAGAGVGVAATTVIGCGSQQAGPQTSATSSAGTGSTAAQAKRGGTLVRRNAIGTTHPFDAGLDAHLLQPTYTSLMRLFYQGLLHLNPRTADIEPELAARWEQPSQTEYVFTLQPGVKWHNKPPVNGRDMTAEDVVYSLNRVRSDEPKFQNRLLLSGVDKIDVVDRTTVRVTTRQPNVSTLTNLAAFPLVVLAREVVEASDRLTTAEQAIGTGAFILTEVEDTHSLVVRNPNYWKPGLPYLDSIRNQYFGDDASAYAAFLSGQIQFCSNPVSGPEAKRLFEEQEGKPYTAEWYKDVSGTSTQPNLQRKPFDDARVTRALRLLIDHDEAAHSWAVTWFGRGYLMSYLPAALESWDFTEQEYVSNFLEFKRPKDEAAREAIRLLNAAGFSRENPLQYDNTGNAGTFTQAMNELYQAQIAKWSQGVARVNELKLFQLAQLNQVQLRGDFDHTVTNIVPPQPYDVDSWFTTFYYTGGGRNYGKMNDAKLNRMIDTQRTIFDTAQRKAYVKDILTYMIEHIPYSSWSGRQIMTIADRRLKGWAPEGASAIWGYNYEQVWFDA
jgi:peptide/nickel transport system substrate-binding protein